MRKKDVKIAADEDPPPPTKLQEIEEWLRTAHARRPGYPSLFGEDWPREQDDAWASKVEAVQLLTNWISRATNPVGAENRFAWALVQKAAMTMRSNRSSRHERRVAVMRALELWMTNRIANRVGLLNYNPWRARPMSLEDFDVAFKKLDEERARAALNQFEAGAFKIDKFAAMLSLSVGAFGDEARPHETPLDTLNRVRDAFAEARRTVERDGQASSFTLEPTAALQSHSGDGKSQSAAHTSFQRGKRDKPNEASDVANGAAPTAPTRPRRKRSR